MFHNQLFTSKHVHDKDGSQWVDERRDHTDPCLTDNGTENKEGFVKVANNEDNVFWTYCSAASLYSFKRESGS